MYECIYIYVHLQQSAFFKFLSLVLFDSSLYLYLSKMQMYDVTNFWGVIASVFTGRLVCYSNKQPMQMNLLDKNNFQKLISDINILPPKCWQKCLVYIRLMLRLFWFIVVLANFRLSNCWICTKINLRYGFHTL